MFRFFESLIQPTRISPEAAPPLLDEPWALMRFYWHFVRQVRAQIAMLFVAGLLVAILDVSIPTIIGRVVGLVSANDAPRG